MSLILSLGSNIGERAAILKSALQSLKKHFVLIQASQIYESPAVDYRDQPHFLNQVLEFKLPLISPIQTLSILANIEAAHGRKRAIPKGPRTLDIDILFWGLESFQSDLLEIPHPRLFGRNFILFPLREIPFFEKLKSKYHFPEAVPGEDIPAIHSPD